MNINKLDLNLLRTFNQLMIERRVSSAAMSLGVSQPAVSNALCRLRGLLRDELFLRTAQGMQPTALAEQIAEPIARAIEAIRSAMAQRVTFEPATGKRTFAIGMSVLGEMFFLPPLLARLAEQAPGVAISTAGTCYPSLKECMEKGSLDIAIGLLPPMHGTFFRQRLFRERFVLAFRKGHPLDGNKLPSVADLLTYKHAAVISSNAGSSEIDRLVKHSSINRKVSVTLPDFDAVGDVLRATDLVATLPLHTAAIFEQPFNLTYTTHPVTLPEVSIEISWHARVHRDPANQWLRRTIFHLFTNSADDAI